MKTAEQLLANPPPAKEPLIDGLLYRRDLVTFGGRRKNGKTTLLMNLGMKLAAGDTGFLGYRIPKAGRVLSFFLEDDSANLSENIKRMVKEVNPNNRWGYVDFTEFMEAGVIPDIDNAKFIDKVVAEVVAFKPDLVIIDNISALVRGEYNEAKVIDRVIIFCQQLSREYDCAVILAAHPRKVGQFDTPDKIIRDTQGFFEDFMGSSHLINSSDSMWGIAVKDKDEMTSWFLGGTQRKTGEEQHSVVTLNENGVMNLVSDVNQNLSRLLSTPKRREAWNSLNGQSWEWDAILDRFCLHMNRQNATKVRKELVRHGLLIKNGRGWVRSTEEQVKSYASVFDAS